MADNDRRVVDLDVILARDLVFRKDGQEYSIPGDLDVDTVLNLFDVFNRALMVDPENQEQVVAQANLLKTTLLDLLKIRHPDLEQLPWGINGNRVVVREILQLLGVIAPEGEPDPSAARATSTKGASPRKTAQSASSKRSRR